MDLAALIDQFTDFKTFFDAIEDIVGALQDLFDKGDEGEPSAADNFSSLSSAEDTADTDGLSSKDDDSNDNGLSSQDDNS